MISRMLLKWEIKIGKMCQREKFVIISMFDLL